MATSAEVGVGMMGRSPDPDLRSYGADRAWYALRCTNSLQHEGLDSLKTDNEAIAERNFRKWGGRLTETRQLQMEGGRVCDDGAGERGEKQRLTPRRVRRNDGRRVQATERGDFRCSK